MNPLMAVVTASLKPIGKYFTEGQAIKAAKRERKDELSKLSLTTRLESIRKGEDTNLKLDATNGGDPIPWANDVSFALFLAPVPLAFFPSVVPHITKGFLAIGNMPEWYQYALGMMLVSVWGYRNLVSPIVQSIAKAYLGRR